MYRTGIKSSFRAHHSLIGDFGDESIPHEHPYVVEWICTVAELNPDGFGVDIDLLNTTLAELLATIDGRLLNDLPFFSGKQTSIENTARYICESLIGALKKSGYPVHTINRSEVRVWESDTAWASFTGSIEE